MRKTRRDFVKDVVIGTTGLSMAGVLNPWAAAAEKKFGYYHHKFVLKKGLGALGLPTIFSGWKART